MAGATTSINAVRRGGLTGDGAFGIGLRCGAARNVRSRVFVMSRRRRLKTDTKSLERMAAIAGALVSQLTDAPESGPWPDFERRTWTQVGLEDQIRGWADDETL